MQSNGSENMMEVQKREGGHQAISRLMLQMNARDHPPMQATGPGIPVGLSQFGEKLFTQKGDMLCGWRGKYQNTTEAVSAGDGGAAVGCCEVLLSHVVTQP